VQVEVGRLLGLDERPSEKQLSALAEAWHSYNNVGTAL